MTPNPPGWTFARLSCVVLSAVLVPAAAEAQRVSCNNRSLNDRGVIELGGEPHTVSGSVTSTQGDVYTFQLDSRRHCTFGFCPPAGSSNYDSWLCLFDEAGALVDQNDDSCAVGAEISTTLEPGTYTIAVSGWDVSAGSYTLAFSSAEVSPFTVGGARPVDVRVPATYDPRVPAPLLLLLHGFAASPGYVEPYLKVRPLADERGFIFIQPHGTFNSSRSAFWNATDACCAASQSEREVDDGLYLRSIIDEVRGLLNVDPDRIYVVGHSNGGFMAYRMACEHADVIAGIASLAGATFATPDECQPGMPVQVLEVHGSSDNTVLYRGGNSQVTGRPYPGAVRTVEQWATYNGCALDVERSDLRLDLDSSLPGAETAIDRYTSGCASGSSVELWTINGGGHGPDLVAVGQSTRFAVHVVDWLLAHPKRPSPQAAFSVMPAEGPAPHTVAVDASASVAPEGTSIASYLWDFGDGTSAEGVAAEHTYGEPGRYIITLVALTGDGRVGEATRRASTVRCPGGDIAPWTAGDVGEPAYPGSAAFDPEGGVELCAGGTTGSLSATQNHFFLHQEVSGDFQVTARIGEIPPGRLAEVGVMLRRGPETGAPFAEMLIRQLSSNRRFRFFSRNLPDERARSRAGSELSAPGGWVRIARSGEMVRGYSSLDGETWTLEHEEAIALGDTCLAGVAASADDRNPDDPFRPLRVTITNLEAAPLARPATFLRGDCNGDGRVIGNVLDAVSSSSSTSKAEQRRPVWRPATQTATAR